jgi:hypothetical protein
MTFTELTPEIVREKLATDQRWLERAVLAIYERQTVDEQDSGDTRHYNGRGFTAGDARPGSRMARWLKSGNHLDGYHLARARLMMPKYANQLILIAREKRQEKFGY